AAAAWLTARHTLSPLRNNAYALAAAGMAVAVFGQLAFEDGRPIQAPPDFDPIPMCVALLAWLAFAAIPRLAFDLRCTFAALAVTGGAIALAGLHETRGVPETLFVGVVYTGSLMALSRRLSRWSIAEITSGLLLVITAGWAGNRIIIGSAALQGLPAANVPFVVAASTAGLWILLAVRLRTHPAAADAPEGLPEVQTFIQRGSLGTAWLLLLAATSLDVLRGVGQVLQQESAQGAALSIWWSLFAVASVALGFRFAAALRWAGLSLLGIVAGKVLLLDTQTLAPPARIVAALSVGLVIIGAGVLYARLKKWTDSPEEAP
ncbi:MAG: DUF2339 domain-containing protein, partial [Planctomycetota bacterium]